MSAIGYWDCSQCGKSVSQAAGHAHPRLRREMISVQTYCAHGPGWDHARCHLITEVAAPPTGQHRDQQNERKIELTKAMTPAHCVSTGTGCPQFGCRLLQPPTNPLPHRGGCDEMTHPAPESAPQASDHVTANGAVIVPPRIAHWLETKAGITADWRERLRDTDLEAHQVMAALHWAATQHRSDIGTKRAAGQSERAESVVWLSTSEAACELRVTDRCIRNWCRTKRLLATMSGARWLINRNDLHIFARTT